MTTTRHAAATEPRWAGFNHPAAWCICACFGILWLLVHQLQWQLPFAPSSTPDQIELWLCAALWLALWCIPSFSKVAALLLVLLAISLLGITSNSPILAHAGSDALLIALSALGISAAARASGFLGWLMSYSHRSAVARQGFACSTGLSLVFALLPSPQSAHFWLRIWQQLPQPLVYAQVSLTAQLCARLLAMASHPANILLIALLPHSGTDRFLPWHWALQTWPLALSAFCFAWWTAQRTEWPTRLPDNTTASSALHEPREQTPSHIFIMVVVVLCIGILLQPLHGLSAGLLAALALVTLFALKVLSAQQFHHGVDWSLLVILIMLPGLIVSFSTAIPQLDPRWDITQTPWLLLPAALLLRIFLPSASVASLGLLFAFTLSTQHGHDLLDLAMPLVVATHLSDFLIQRTQTASHSTHRYRSLLIDPVSWCTFVVFNLWCVWYGW